MTNPTSGADVADSGGWFPQVFAASGGLYDIIEKDAAGVTLASYLSVPSLGTTSGNLSLDFTNCRYQVRGSAGTVEIEVGDPVGDDVGGTGRIGGWNNTQADSLTLDAALVNVTGRMKEQGFKIPGVVRTAATAFTTAATVDIPLTNDPTGCRAWEIVIFDLIMSTTGTLQLRLSYDGGSTFKAGGTDYSQGLIFNAASVGSAFASDTGVLGLLSTGSSQTPANKPGLVKATVITPNSGSSATVVQSEASLYDITGGAPLPQRFSATNYGLGAYGRATHLRFLPSAGTVTGSYMVKALRGYGEA